MVSSLALGTYTASEDDGLLDRIAAVIHRSHVETGQIYWFTCPLCDGEAEDA